MTFRLQIVLLSTLLLITAIGTATVIFARLSAGELTREIGRSMSVLATEMSDRLDREMAVRISEVRVLAGLPSMREMTRTDVIQRTIDSLQDEVSAFTWVGILDPEGTVIAATDGVLVGKNISHRPVFMEAQNEIFIGDVHDALLLAKLLPNPTGEAMKFVDISQPIFAESGALKGIFAVHLSWRWARDVADALLTFNAMDRTAEIFVVARDGTILLSPLPDLIGHSLPLDSIGAASRGETGWAVEVWPDGHSYVTGYTATDGEGGYSGLGWSVLTRAPADEALQPVTDIVLAMVAAAMLVLFAACALAMILSGRLVRPLQAMTDAAEKMRVERGGPFPDIPGPKEVRTLCSAFQSLLTVLNSTERQAEYLQDKANTDPLTGLANRSGLDAFFSQRQGGDQPFAVLALDLDDFKRINDTYGHDAGDAVLRQIADRLKRMFRPSDIIARSGGDEFLAVIAIPDTDDDGPAQRIAERLIEVISASIEVALHDDDPVTVSIGASVGLSSYPRDGQDRDSVTKAADDALYAAKHAGKGRFVVASEGAVVVAN